MKRDDPKAEVEPDTTQEKPALRQIVGALLFAARGPLNAAQIRRVLLQVQEEQGEKITDSAPSAGEAEIRAAVSDLKETLLRENVGLEIVEVAGGFRLQNELSCGPWIRRLLGKGRPSRLSRPALETLAIVAYRQPCTRAEIESVRGVSVDQILRNLLEMELIRIAGRSKLPGRPLLFATTRKFLEHFGLRNLDELPGVEELRKREDARAQNTAKTGESVTHEDTRDAETGTGGNGDE